MEDNQEVRLCYDCKHWRKLMTEKPCSDCWEINEQNETSYWEPIDGDTEDKCTI